MNLPEQGSDDWKALRKGKATATKIAIWLGLSPYRTPLQLYEEELGLIPPQEVMAHMTAGNDIEPEARRWFLHNIGIDVEPKIVFAASNDRFMASLDGCSADGQTILEIKKNNRDYHEKAKSGKPVEFHVIQMQWQMYCADVENCHYLSYRRGDEVIVVVHRDNAMIAKLVDAANEFLHAIDTQTPPTLTERDYEDLSDSTHLMSLALQYDSDNRMSQFYKDRADATKEQIKSLCGDRNAKGKNWKLTKYIVKGRLDYDALLKSLGEIDTTPYRKPPITSYRITLD